MTPQHLLALCAVTLLHAKSVVLLTVFGSTRTVDFWWDLTLDRSAPISRLINRPLSTEDIDNGRDDIGLETTVWERSWGNGTSKQWLAGEYGFWTAWAWNSHYNNDISGGGFIYNETEPGVAAGVNWLLQSSTGTITWNCFVEGIVPESLPWTSWSLKIGNTEIGFLHADKKWGFSTGDYLVLSKHCATGTPVIGKRYKISEGKEEESSVEVDPFNSVERVKRAPQWLEKVSQTLKEWMEKIKKVFSGGDQKDDQNGDNPEGKEGGKKCFSVIDLMVRIIDMILGRRRPGASPEGPPSMPQPPGGIPQGPNGEMPDPEQGGGDPPGGADEPPRDVEEIDPEQNDAIRDWE